MGEVTIALALMCLPYSNETALFSNDKPNYRICIDQYIQCIDLNLKERGKDRSRNDPTLWHESMIACQNYFSKVDILGKK